MIKIQRRAFPRINCEVPIVVKPENAPSLHTAILKNYSDAGIYFEISQDFEEGTTIQVKADNDSILDPVTSGSWDTRRAEVRWCRLLEDGPPVLFGCGVAYLSNEED